LVNCDDIFQIQGIHFSFCGCSFDFLDACFALELTLAKRVEVHRQLLVVIALTVIELGECGKEKGREIVFLFGGFVAFVSSA
jgi:hypothetical protein